MRIAVLGGLGFVGRRLTSFLQSQGHEVFIFVLNNTVGEIGNIPCIEVSELSRSQNSYANSFDVVINLAAKRSTPGNPLTDLEVQRYNFTIPRDFILQASRTGALVLNTSTYIQNFRGIEGNPTDSYSASKQELTSFLARESDPSQFKTLDLYLFTVYGPGDKDGRLIPYLISSLMNNKPVEISWGMQLMNLIHVDDLVQNMANTLNLDLTAPYSNAFVWSEEYLSVRELVNRIQILSGRELECKWGSREYSGHEMFEIWPIPMKQLPGFFSTIDLNLGLSRLLSLKTT